MPVITTGEDRRGVTPIIQCTNMVKRYVHGVDVFTDASLTVQKGEFVFIMGASGAGKTTLLKVMLAMEELNQGVILLEGRNIQRFSRREIPYMRRRIGVVFQDFRLLPNRTVFQNVALPLEVAGKPPSYIRKKVEQVLRFVWLEKRQKTPCRHLSGGEQQRVAVARAVVSDPVMVLADEPTGNLDISAAKEIISLFSSLHGRGTTVLVATHDRTLPDLVPGCREVIIERGKIFELGPQSEFDGNFYINARSS